ncbi:DNA polymerase/3'-5' exonuclease PolX [uncultured Methanofollis sp.]|uniref:DNA polymerase/3'-5' exonuclease PolX n=1 Tax=uncultured Methanofollis sp. TaxID=262500 RepID=UPI002604A533|nr:DNA polymerase/3'-5' exonuclease PolX [uncultured Methanofollis sp.]
MAMTNRQVAAVLQEIGQLLDIHEENPYKVRAYERAAELVGMLDRPVATMGEDDLQAVPGIGKALAEKILAIAATGTCPERDRLLAATPSGLPALLALQGVGPKTVGRLWKVLGVEGIDDLEAAARNRRVRALKGFGPKKEQEILRAVEEARKGAERMTVAEAGLIAAAILAVLPGEARVAGSLRRGRSTVGDIDIVTSALPGPANRALRAIAESVVEEGEKKTSLRIRGRQADIRYARPGEEGAMLLYLTGSKAFNIRLREIARTQGMRLNEYGLTDMATGRISVYRTEEEVFAALGMAPVPPELREDRGEVECALRGDLPLLVDETDIRGDLHVHSDWSDGAMSLDAIAAAGEERGYEYVLVTDHSASLGIARGLDASRLQKQQEAIRRVNRTASCTLLSGVEVDILADGRLALPSTVLDDCDLVVASVHSAFRQDADTLTRRVIAAMEHEQVDIVGHPTGRLLGRRPATAIDMARVIDAAALTGTALEINASPVRMDLDDIYIRQAKEKGVKLAIGTDAHSSAELSHIGHGVALARRGWCSAGDVLNTCRRADLPGRCQ